MPEPQVTMRWTCEERPDGRLELGETLKGVVSVFCEEEIKCRAILLWVGCRVHGSGTQEKVDALPESPIHHGPLPAGQKTEVGFEVRLPWKAPISYQGRYIKCDWEAVVRIDVPIWFDRRFTFGFEVLPRVTQPPREAEPPPPPPTGAPAPAADPSPPTPGTSAPTPAGSSPASAAGAAPPPPG